MTTTLQPGSHLDADQLNAFAEGALPAQERALCLTHLSECAHCREILFLAGAAIPQEEQAPAPVRAPWLSWWKGLSLMGAAVAATLVIAFTMHRAQTVPAPTPVAEIKQPTLPPQPQPASESPSAAQTPAHVVAAKPQPRVSATEPAAKPTPTVPITVDGVAGATINSSQIESLPINGRSYASHDDTARNRSYVPAAPSPSPLMPLGGPVAQTVPLSQPRSLHGDATTAMGRSVPAAPLSADTATTEASEAAAPAAKLRTFTNLNAHGVDLIPDNDGATGIIMDVAGAVIPGAKITAVNLATGTQREAITDSKGHFNIASLAPGQYRFTIAALGFSTSTRTVDLGTHQLAQLDQRLEVGAVSDTVEVSASAAVLATDSVSFAQLLPNTTSFRTAVALGDRTLGLDNAGALFLRKKPGKPYKKVHTPWTTPVTTLVLTLDGQAQITTQSGAWRSKNGDKWTLAPSAK